MEDAGGHGVEALLDIIAQRVDLLVLSIPGLLNLHRNCCDCCLCGSMLAASMLSGGQHLIYPWLQRRGLPRRPQSGNCRRNCYWADCARAYWALLLWDRCDKVLPPCWWRPLHSNIRKDLG